MKSKTESLISALRVLARDIHTDDGVVNACLEEAAGRLEELERANKNTLADLAVAIERRDDSYAEIKTVRRELSESIRERNKQRDEALKNQQPTTVAQINELREINQELKTELNYALAELHQARGNARPEPSRLEIAAMCLQGMVSSGSWGQSAAVVALEYTDKLIAAVKEAKGPTNRSTRRLLRRVGFCGRWANGRRWNDGDAC